VISVKKIDEGPPINEAASMVSKNSNESQE
jgi:hypothetical protein